MDSVRRLREPSRSIDPFVEAAALDPAHRSFRWPWIVLVAIGALLSWALYRAGGVAETGPAADSPRRVVLFGPNLNEMAWVLGHADRLVAITDYCRWPPEILHLPRIGGQLDPDLEALALLHPDLLVLQGESPLLRSFAAAQGLAVADLKADDAIASILDGAVRLDRLLGGDGALGRAVADSLRAALDAVAADAKEDAAELPTVLLVLARDPDDLGDLLTAGEGTFLDELVEIAGGRSWARPRGSGYYNVALEALFADPPDCVIEIFSTSVGDDRTRRELAWRRSLRPAPFVAFLDFEGALVPGPRIVETARLLRARLAQRADS